MEVVLHKVSFTAQDEDEGEVRLLSDVDINIKEGDWVGIMGASGCGKSTLLSLIVGLYEPTHGQVLRDGLGTLSKRQFSQLSYLPQDPAFLIAPWKPVVKHLDWACDLRGEAETSPVPAATLLEVAELKEKRPHQRPSTLSGGERKRLAFVLSLSHQPRLLVLDEPFTGVDLDLRVRLWDLLWEYRRRSAHPLTCVFTTHDITEAALLADYVLFLQHHPGGAPTTISPARPMKPTGIQSRRPSELMIEKKDLDPYERDLLNCFRGVVNWDIV